MKPDKRLAKLHRKSELLIVRLTALVEQLTLAMTAPKPRAPDPDLTRMDHKP